MLKWFAIPFSSGTHLFRTLHNDPSSWVALRDMAHSFIELDKIICLLVFCDCAFHSLCPLMDKDKRLMEASRWEELVVGESGFALMGRTMLTKSLNQLMGETVFPSSSSVQFS